MPKQSGLGQRLYVAGFDLSGDVGVIDTLGSANNLLNVRGIDKLAEERIIGRRTGQLSFTAFFNDADDQEHDALKGLPATDVLALWLMSVTRGDACAALTAKQANYDMSLGADSSLTFKVDLQGTAGFFLEYGVILVAKITHSSETDETAHDQGGASSDGAVGFLQHFEDTSPTGTIEYDIEDSSDNLAFGNLIAFNDVATPYAAYTERKSVDGEVLQHLRASTNGTFTDAPFSMGIRIRQALEVDAA